MKNVKLVDLFWVITIGLITSLMAGAFAGIMNYMLLSSVSISLHLFYLFGVMFMASYIRRQYEYSTKLYRLIAVYFAMVGYGFSYLFILMLGQDFELMILLNSLFSSLILLPVLSTIFVFITTFSFSFVFELFFIFLFGYFAYKNTY